MIATSSSSGDTAQPKMGIMAMSAPSALRFVDSFDVFIFILLDYFLGDRFDTYNIIHLSYIVNTIYKKDQIIFELPPGVLISYAAIFKYFPS